MGKRGVGADISKSLVFTGSRVREEQRSVVSMSGAGE